MMRDARGRGNRSARRWTGGAALPFLSLLLSCAAAPPAVPDCLPDDAGLSVPAGFCALVVADGLGRARHLAVAANGDVIVATPARDSGGGVQLLRDTTGDGVADVRRTLIEDPMAVAVQLWETNGRSWLYYSTHHEVIRLAWSPGADAVDGAPDTIVSGLPGARQHGSKTFVLADGGRLFVNHGAPSNSCQVDDREPRSPGMDPCPLLDTTGGIWLYAADRSGQTGADGERYATGLRNTVAMAVNPADGELYGVMHGRDALGQLWGFSDSANAAKPAEEFFRITRRTDGGWPYCYYDPQLDRKVLAPEYGGNGEEAGRCATTADPIVAFPAHWAPDGLHFHSGTGVPEDYRGGAFVAFHGSWNRAPLPQEGFKIVFVPFAGATPGEWRVFADGFQGVESRPVGVTEGADGSLYVSDDGRGRVYRILYRGGP